MKTLITAAIALCLTIAFPAFAAQSAANDIQYVEGGLPSLPPVSGELDKLPKELTGSEYSCGEYFAGSDDDNPDAPVTFALKKKETGVKGKKTILTVVFIMTKKNVSVVRDDKRTVPFATVKVIEGRKKVEVKVPTAIMNKATCLPKPRGLKGA